MSYRMKAGALKKLREEMGLTQDQLAAMSGVSQSSVSLHERSYCDPPASVIKAYALALGMKVQEFMDKTYVEIDEVA